MEHRNTLNKTEKLKSRKAIDALFAKRESFATGFVRVFYSIERNEENIAEIKTGFGCSKKYFKRAVQRNRVKRLMREAYRTQKHSLLELISQQKKSLHVFYLFSNNEMTNFKEMQETFVVILQRLEKILQKSTIKNI